MTYFRTGKPHYHRRNVVSRSCSGWEGVGPTRYGRQEFVWNHEEFGEDAQYDLSHQSQTHSGFSIGGRSKDR
jgi:hypothetical protein